MKLSEELRERTAEAHRGAEGSAFVARFVRGGLDRDMFSRHMLALHGVYAALEDAFERLKDEPRLGAFVLPQLWRRLALERDLDFLRGPHWRSEEPVAAARAYADRLRWIEENQPIRLASHSYVRYLGDLSGGQMLKGLAARQLELDGDGLRFYEFPAIHDPLVFKAEYRRRLDELALAYGERDTIVEEARTAFQLNAAIFDQLVTGAR
jgi:heme oxygenase